jgi:pimeloyl-ACP methyl ester carboxylesterase
MEAGQGNPVVILESPSHLGWGLSELHDALAQNYRVIAFELPGFGYSPVNTRSQSINDLANIATQAAQKIAQDKYTLIGTSFSANVALWQTLQAPDQVEALILISPTALQPTSDLTAGTLEQMAKGLLVHPGKVSGLPLADPAIVAKEQSLMRRLQSANHEAEVESRLSEIRCATLVVFGSKDRMVSPEAAGIYREKIPNSNVSIVYDAGHVIIAERPEALINTVADYVERHEAFVVSRLNSLINP